MQMRADLLAIQLNGSTLFEHVNAALRRPNLKALEAMAAESTSAIAQVWGGAGPSDSFDPSLSDRDFFVRVWVPYARAEDAKDEEALVGLDLEQGDPGAAEVEESVLAALRLSGPDADGGAQLLLRSRGAYRDLVEGVQFTLSYTSLVVDARDYPPPSRFAAVDAAGGGDTDLTWTLAPGRWDRNAIILRRAAGSTAPTSETSGTGVTVAAEATSVTDSPGAGTFSYALFQEYDESLAQDGSLLKYSSAAVTATVSVT